MAWSDAARAASAAVRRGRATGKGFKGGKSGLRKGIRRSSSLPQLAAGRRVGANVVAGTPNKLKRQAAVKRPATIRVGNTRRRMRSSKVRVR